MHSDQQNIVKRDIINYGLVSNTNITSPSGNTLHFPSSWQQYLFENQMDSLLTSFKEFIYASTRASELTQEAL